MSKNQSHKIVGMLIGMAIQQQARDPAHAQMILGGFIAQMVGSFQMSFGSGWWPVHTTRAQRRIVIVKR